MNRAPENASAAPAAVAVDRLDQVAPGWRRMRPDLFAVFVHVLVVGALVSQFVLIGWLTRF